MGGVTIIWQVTTLTSIAENPATEAAEIPRLARMYIATYADTANVDSILARYEACPELEYVERDTVQLVAYANYYPNQWTLNNTGQVDTNYNAVDIDAPEAWSLIGGGSASIKIAVLDHEIWTGHPDLAGRISDSLNAVNPMFGTTNFMLPSHGTPIAGIIVGTDDNSGIKGIAYNSKIAAYVVFAESSTIHALYAAKTTGVHVISSSVGTTFGASGIVEAMGDIAASNDILFCIAAGTNQRNNLAFRADEGLGPRRIAVGQICYTGIRSPSSHYEPGTASDITLSVVAPSFGTLGENCVNSDTTEFAYAWNDPNSLYSANFGGTSAATPHVAGIAALLFADDMNLSASTVKDIIEASAIDVLVDIAPEDTGLVGWDKFTGWGIANAHRAMLFPLLTSPSGGGPYEPDDDILITWRTPKNNYAQVKTVLSFSLDGGESWSVIDTVEASGNATTSYNWSETEPDHGF
jgi:subtilisin family serine protease